MKRLLSVLLVLMMLLSLVPAALASEEVEPAEEIEPVEAEVIEETPEEAGDAQAVMEEDPEPVEEPAEEPVEDGSDGEPVEDGYADGPEDIWAAITALEEAAGAYAPEDYDALLPEVEEIILSFPAYVEGTLEYRDGILFWWSEGVLNGYSGEARARNNGYWELDESSAYAAALLEDQLALIEADMTKAPALDGAGNSGYDVTVFRPFAGYAGDTTPQEFGSLGSMLAFHTGGKCHVYEAQQATIDALADALESSVAVIIHTHGNGGYLFLTNGAGITQADMQDSHAWNSGTSDKADGRSVWEVDGTAIVNHMEKKANNCLVWCGACQSMKTDRTCAPLRNNGVAVMVGFSETVYSVGNAAFASAFLYSLANQGCTAAEAFENMREACGCNWDPVFPNYTLEQAQQYGIAFPVLVSAQDPYPGEGHVNVVQEPRSTWTLPQNKTDFTPDLSTSTQTIMVNTDAGDFIAPVKTTETFQTVVCADGALPKGMSWSWSGHELRFTGTPTEKGCSRAYFSITTVSGKVYQHDALFMVKDSKVTTSSQTETVTAPSGEDSYVLSAQDRYYIALAFPSDAPTWTMDLISGRLPMSLSYGFSDTERGYVRSVSDTSYLGYFLATAPGSYRITLEIINYSGDVFRHTLNLTVKPASVIAADPVNIVATQYREYERELLSDEDYFDIMDITCIRGSLPDGVFVAAGPSRRFGVYGTPTEAGDFTATYHITSYNNAYIYTFNVHVVKGTGPVYTGDIALTGLTMPAAGAEAKADAKAGSSAYTITEQTWTDSSMNVVTAFEEGTMYIYEAKVTLPDERAFPEDWAGSIYVNGEKLETMDGLLFSPTVRLTGAEAACYSTDGNTMTIRVGRKASAAGGDEKNIYELDLSGAVVSGSEISGTGRVVKTAGDQPEAKKYVYIVVNYERPNGTTWAVAGTYAVDPDGEFDLPTISGVTDIISNVLVVGVDSKTGASWAGHNITKPGRIKP